MSGYAKLKGYFVEKGIKQQTVAEVLNTSRVRLNLILNGQRGHDFEVHEVVKLCDTFKISVNDYFFDHKVASTQPQEVIHD